MGSKPVLLRPLILQHYHRFPFSSSSSYHLPTLSSHLSFFRTRYFRSTSFTMASNKTVAPYGTWKSPITADILTQKSVSFGEITVLSSNENQAEIAYVENRPEESGRAAFIKQSIRLNSLEATRNGVLVQDNLDLSKGEYNVRSGVHEYGGGAVAKFDDGGALFTDYKSFNIFTTDSNGNVRQITEDNKALRYADFSKHPTLPFILAIQEDHTLDEPSKVVNTLVAIHTETRKVYTVAQGYDFYTSPRFSADGNYAAYVAWNHPSMPFWATELWIAKFVLENDQPSFASEKKVCGNNTDEVARHPVWASSDTLYFTWDKSGFSNPWKVSIKNDRKSSNIQLNDLKPLLSKPFEGDFSSPPWSLGNSDFVVLSPDWLVCIITSHAYSTLNLLHIPTGQIRRLDTPFVDIYALQVAGTESIVFRATEASQPNSLIVLNLAESLKAVNGKPTWNVIKRSSSIIEDGTIPPTFLPKCEPIEFPTELPNGKKSTSHALLFLPGNPDYLAPAGTSPPCIMKIHGGPTSHATPGLDLSTSYWTSRGYALCKVNYGGSTSFGREFMNRLMAQWGVVDVRDTIAAANYLGSSDHGKQNSKAIRRIDSKAQEQNVSLEEKKMINGAVEFTLKKQHSWLDSVTNVLIGTTVGAASSFVPNVDARFAVFVGGLTWLLRHITRVQRESALVMPNIGIQLSTVRGFLLPTLTKELEKSNFIATASSSKLIPRDAILDVFTKESIRRWKVIDYVAIATKNPGSSIASEKASSPTSSYGNKLQVLFPNLLPGLPVVERVYRTIHPLLFGQHTNSAVSVPPRADPKKIAISGGSAGGYTVLAALCLSPHAFGAGADYFGVSNIADLAAESHKFESQYVNQLMGGPPEKIPEIYKSRSPIYMADRIRSPLLILQGEIDKVVPPAQNKTIYEAVKKQGVKTKYIEFEGEGHGFRKSENIKRSLEEEEAWYREAFNL